MRNTFIEVPTSFPELDESFGDKVKFGDSSKVSNTGVTPRPERVYGSYNRRGAYVYQKTFLII